MGPAPRSANRLTLSTDIVGLKFRGTVGQLCTISQWGNTPGTGSRYFVGDHKGRHSAPATCTSSSPRYYLCVDAAKYENSLAGSQTSNRFKERVHLVAGDGDAA